MRRLAGVAAATAALALALAGCGGGGGAATPTPTTPPSTTTTTLSHPLVLRTAAALELDEGQCFAARPGPEEGAPTTTTTAPPPGEVVLDEVLVVECGAAHDARVYGATCLGPDATGELVVTGCPGSPDTPWPGDRDLRQAAVRFCLQRFADELGEPYATSERTTVELVPNREEWAAGHHRVVCGVEP